MTFSLSDVIGRNPTRIGDLLDLPANAYPDKPAIETPTHVVSYKDLRSTVEKLREQLAARGVGRGQRWGLSIGKREVFFSVFFALSQLGCAISPLQSKTPDDLLHAVDSAELDGVVASDNLPIQECERQKDWCVRTEIERGLWLYSPATYRSQRLSQPIDIDPALILWTSGSMADPRPVVFEHHAVLANIRSNIIAMGYDDEDRTLVVLPLQHAYGLIHQCLCQLAIGATLCFPATPLLPAILLQTIARRSVTTISLIPTLLDLLVAELAKCPAEGQSLRIVTVGAARAKRESILSLLDFAPQARVILTYGLTEAGPRVSSQIVERDSFDPAWIGDPLPNTEVTLSLSELAREEIVIRSRSVFRGYGDQETTWLNHGNLHTRDLGRREGNRILLEGRLDRAINCAGKLLSAEGIEGVFLLDSAVERVRITKTADDIWGEVPVAHVVLAKRADVSEKQSIKYRVMQRLGLAVTQLQVVFVEAHELPQDKEQHLTTSA